MCLGIGVVLLFFPYEVINFELMGEEDFGVVVDKSYNLAKLMDIGDSLIALI